MATEHLTHASVTEELYFYFILLYFFKKTSRLYLFTFHSVWSLEGYSERYTDSVSSGLGGKVASEVTTRCCLQGHACPFPGRPWFGSVCHQETLRCSLICTRKHISRRETLQSHLSINAFSLKKSRGSLWFTRPAHSRQKWPRATAVQTTCR